MKEYRIIGAPGTGKTTHLGQQVESAVETGLSVSVASLTRTAAAEVISRGLPVDHRSIGTLHSHAYRALDRPVIADSPKMLKRWNEDNPHLAISGGRSIDEDNLDPAGAKTTGDELYNRMNLARAQMLPIERGAPVVRDFHQRWTTWKRENELLDFTDLIETSLEFRSSAPGLPDVLFLNEAQDMSRLEMALARKW